MPRPTAPASIRRKQRTALIMLVIAGTLNYLDRSTLSVANPLIRQELGLSIADMGLLLSAFLWAYAFAQLPGGALVDRLHVLCYGLDPAHGLYNGAVRAALVVVSGLTLLSLCGAVLLAERRRRRPHGTARS